MSTHETSIPVKTLTIINPCGPSLPVHWLYLYCNNVLWHSVPFFFFLSICNYYFFKFIKLLLLHVHSLLSAVELHINDLYRLSSLLSYCSTLS